MICCVDLPTFSILVPSRNRTWIGAYEWIGCQLVRSGQWRALPNINYKYLWMPDFTWWQSAESHGCKVFKCTSGADRQSLHTSCGKYLHSQWIYLMWIVQKIELIPQVLHPYLSNYDFNCFNTSWFKGCIRNIYLKICCSISLNIAINMVVALQPTFCSKQVIDEFVDEANLIRQQNRH